MHFDESELWTWGHGTIVRAVSGTTDKKGFQIDAFVLIGSQSMRVFGRGRHQTNFIFKSRSRKEKIIIATFHFGIMVLNTR